MSAICVLALNNVNDKVFLLVWWWLFGLFILGIGRIVLRIIQVRVSSITLTTYH